MDDDNGRTVLAAVTIAKVSHGAKAGTLTNSRCTRRIPFGNAHLLLLVRSHWRGCMRVFRWLGVLGSIGFLCGFVGPIVLAPESNQGPMLGLFITGPTGVLLGAILGVVAGAARLSAQTQSRVLVTASLVVALVTLYLCVPPDRLSATVVDAEVRSCVPVQSLRAQTIDRLNELTAARQVPEHVQWAEKFDQDLAAKPGVAIDVHVLRDSQVFEKQARWNRGTKFATPWQTDQKDQRYFAADEAIDCANYPAGLRSQLAVTGITGTWPPYGIAELLGLRTAARLPADYAQLLAHDGTR